MKKVCTIILCVCLSLGASAQKALQFDANRGVKSSIERFHTLPTSDYFM